jgi:hypothetical protein
VKAGMVNGIIPEQYGKFAGGSAGKFIERS